MAKRTLRRFRSMFESSAGNLKEVKSFHDFVSVLTNADKDSVLGYADEIREDMAAIQIAVKDMQLEIERGLRANDVIFLDGAVPGSLTWCRAFGLDPNDILPDCFHHRYASVFILDPLPFQENGARNGDAPIADYLDEWLARDYSALGYNVVRIPVLPLEERLAIVLERLSRQGLI